MYFPLIQNSFKFYLAQYKIGHGIVFWTNCRAGSDSPKTSALHRIYFLIIKTITK
jgi:hypothetical protein